MNPCDIVDRQLFLSEEEAEFAFMKISVIFTHLQVSHVRLDAEGTEEGRIPGGDGGGEGVGGGVDGLEVGQDGLDVARSDGDDRRDDGRGEDSDGVDAEHFDF